MPKSVAELVDRILDEAAPYFDRPVTLFGHSLGALVAFELARAMDRRQMLSPARLFVSASRAPQVPRRQPPIHHLEDREFIQAMAKINGTPDEILKHQELLHLLLPALRADFRLAETYQYIPGQRLSCAITAIGGQEDALTTRGDLVAWHSQTTGAFNLRIVPGAHFFLQSHASSVAKLVANTISQV
jgi:surfactin synthase thioesterase subunit